MSASLLVAVLREVERADAKFGPQLDLPNGTAHVYEALANRARSRTEAAASAGTVTWRHVLGEEVLEAFAEEDPALLRAELIQVAAVALRWIHAIDRGQ